jgi:hypothetical protein
MARRSATNGNGKQLASQQSVNAVVKSICDIMRRSNCAGALQYVPELRWILFLRILDERKTREAEEAEAVGAEFTPSLEPGFRWQDWRLSGPGLRAHGRGRRDVRWPLPGRARGAGRQPGSLKRGPGVGAPAA